MSVINTKSRVPDYSDLDLDFIAKPGTKDITKKIGEEAIKRSIRNIIFTNFYDRLFNPTFGSNIYRLLFSNVTDVTAILISDAVKEVLRNYEPRCSVLAADVSPSEDMNAYNVRITYTILNRPEPYVTDIFLERIR